MWCLLAIVSLLATGHGLETLPRLPKSITPKPNSDGARPRIVGGETASIEDFPFTVSLQYNGPALGYDVVHYCTGVIISADYVITTGACIRIFNMSEVFIRAGSDFFYEGGTIHQVESYTLHPDFDYDDYHWDVGVIKLQNRLSFGSKVRAATLPSPNHTLNAGTQLTMPGWGVTGLSEWFPTQLLYTSVQAIDHDACVRFWGEQSINEANFCTYEEEAGPCVGDAGAPLLHDGQLIGLVSWSFGCATNGYPDVNTYVPPVTEWIIEVTGISSATTAACSISLIVISFLLELR